MIWLKIRENPEGSKRKRCITHKRSATKITADISKNKITVKVRHIWSNIFKMQNRI